MFGDRVREYREAKRRADGKRWTQRDLADAVGVDENTVGNWESGRTEPSVPTKRTVAVALGVPYERLTDEAEAPTVAEEEKTETFYQSAAPLLRPRVYERVYDYIGRMKRGGCTPEQIEEATRVLYDSAYSKINKSDLRVRTEDDQIIDIDAAWEWIRRTIREHEGKDL